MPKKIKTKLKQKQQQKQTVIVNISQPKRSYKPKAPVSKPKTLSLLPMMPSFNINQPSQSSDLSKLVGMLIPKLQTQSTLGSSIPPPIPTDVPIPSLSTELQSNIKENLLGELIENKVKKTKRNKQEMAEARQMGGEDISSINLGLSKYNFIPQEESETTIENLSEITSPVIVKKIRKNSLEDLQQRYYAQTGQFMDISRGYKIKDFKELVEKMERL